MNILSKELDKAAVASIFTPHMQCLDPFVTYLSDADDILILFDGSTTFLEGIMDVFDRFYIGSGLVINLRKTFLFLDGITRPDLGFSI